MSVKRPKALIIAEYIAPVQAIASIRWTKFAKYLSKNYGYDITVLTNRKSFKKGVFQSKPYSKDAALEKDAAYFTTLEIPYSFGQFAANALFNIGKNVLDAIKARSDKASQSNKVKAVPSQGSDSTERPSSTGGSFLVNSFPEKVFDFVDTWCGTTIFRAGAKAPVDWDSYDIMISTYGPLWTHKIAGIVKAHQPQIFWIADFRDPIVRSTRTDDADNRKLAQSVSMGADLVTAVSQGTLDNLFLDHSTRSSILVNGFDPEEVAKVKKSATNRFSLVYTGTLYSDDSCKSDLNPLFQSLEEAVELGYIDHEDVVIEYAGPTSYLFEQCASKYPNIPSIDHGLLTRGKALELQSQASVLVVASWNTAKQQGVLTGKVFEYLSRDIPILGLCSGDIPNSSLRKLIEDCLAGICYEEADESTYVQLTSFLREQYATWRNRGNTVRDPRAAEKVAQYSYPELTNRLVELIKR